MDAGNTASTQGFIPNVQAPGLQRGWDCNLITHHLTSVQIPTPLLKGKSTLRGSQTQRIQSGNIADQQESLPGTWPTLADSLG